MSEIKFDYDLVNQFTEYLADPAAEDPDVTALDAGNRLEAYETMDESRHLAICSLYIAALRKSVDREVPASLSSSVDPQRAGEYEYLYSDAQREGLLRIQYLQRTHNALSPMNSVAKALVCWLMEDEKQKMGTLEEVGAS